MPHVGYVYYPPGGVIVNCLPAPAAMAAPGVPGPNLPGLAGMAGAALPGLAAGLPGAGFGPIPGVANLLPYTWAALNNTALAIGLYPPGMHPLYEMNWRMSNLRMAAYTEPGGRLRRTPLLGNLETQEKIWLSYFVGMVLGAYVARAAAFGMPMHFARYGAVNGGPGVAYVLNAALAGVHRPDLVFVDPVNGTCQLWEGKGRGTIAVPAIPAFLLGALQQPNRITSVLVAGALVGPNARVASLARIDPGTGRWRLSVADPPDNVSGERRMEDRTPFYREFYRPFLQMVEGSSETVAFAGHTYLVTGQAGRRVGIDQRIQQVLASGTGDVAAEIEGFMREGYGQDPERADRYVSPEGILTEAVEEDLGIREEVTGEDEPEPEPGPGSSA